MLEESAPGNPWLALWSGWNTLMPEQLTNCGTINGVVRVKRFTFDADRQNLTCSSYENVPIRVTMVD
jgi:hypothetical protein